MFGVIAGLTLGVVASRAITSGFAAMLRSRRVRDLAVLVIALLASSIGPVALLIDNATVAGDFSQANSVARVLAWSPLGAGYALPYDVGEGRWMDATVRLAVMVVTIGLLLWWWSRTLESAMLATSTGVSPKRVGHSRGGAVAALVPRALRGVIRPTVFGAIIAGEARFWWRDPRRRAGLVSILMATLVLSVVLNISVGPTPGSGDVGPVLTFGFVVSMAGILAGSLLANQFAYDGNAYAAHLLGHVAGRLEVRARAAAIGFVSMPAQVLVVAAVAVLTGLTDQLPTGLGMLAAAFGVSVAVAALLSVLAPYPLPDSTNPFALNTGGAGAKGLLAALAMLGTAVLCVPVVVAALFLAGMAAGPWLMLGLGLAYGGAAVWLGTHMAGDLLDRRGPELLAAVTPRR
jgi:ABC-2 type transport system permease protein